MNQKLVFAKQAISSATALLVAQWIMAILSIPGSRQFATEIANGTAPEKIVTIYDNFSLLITISLAWAWLATNRFMHSIYQEELTANPTATKFKSFWVSWGWIAPLVSFWFPKRIVDDLLKAKATRTGKPNPIGKGTGTWWATWVCFVLINDLDAYNALTNSSIKIQPSFQIAAACMLTASYLVWTNILRSFAQD